MKYATGIETAWHTEKTQYRLGLASGKEEQAAESGEDDDSTNTVGGPEAEFGASGGRDAGRRAGT